MMVIRLKNAINKNKAEIPNKTNARGLFDSAGKCAINLSTLVTGAFEVDLSNLDTNPCVLLS